MSFSVITLLIVATAAIGHAVEHAGFVAQPAAEQITLHLHADVAIGRELVGKPRSTKSRFAPDCSRSKPTAP